MKESDEEEIKNKEPKRITGVPTVSHFQIKLVSYLIFMRLTGILRWLKEQAAAENC